HLNLNARITRDIDYSVFINSHEEWDLLNNYLLSQGLKRDPQQPYRFYLEEFIIDLLPFGDIEENGEVILNDPIMEISVYGCREVVEEAIVIHDKYKVISLPGLCILKLIAYNEHTGRLKDWNDFSLILSNYFNIAGEQLFEGNHLDLLENDIELPVASARMLGRQMQTILNKKDELKNRILAILEQKIKHFSPQEIDQMYQVREMDDKQVELLKLILETQRGINDVLVQS
ncbi:MAG: hypothetical protein KGM98_11380, partial [Bacteroidota bacterium]|nr:hypothetical protein [Bacteroidota bacterium]